MTACVRLHDRDLCLQVILLSATMPQDVLEVTTKFMRDPVRILVKKEELTLEGIRQFYIEVEREVRPCLNSQVFNYGKRVETPRPIPLMRIRLYF